MTGLVKLELFNKNGKCVKKIEDHNMLTNFLKDSFRLTQNNCLFQTGGYSGSADVLNKLGNHMHRYFGTLQVLGETVSEDPGEYFANGEKVVGLATYKVGYAGDNPAYGTYNGTESGWSEDGSAYTYVYDFDTSKANGTIKALGLMPINAGAHGFGLPSVDKTAMFNNDVSKDQEYLLGQPFGQQLCAPCYNTLYAVRPFIALPDKNCIIGIQRITSKFWYNSNYPDDYIGKSKKLPFVKMPYEFYQMGFHQIATKMSYYNNTIKKDYTPFYEMNLKNTLNETGNNYGFLSVANGKIFALYTNTQNWAPNAEYIMTVYDVVSGTESYVTIKNTTGKTLMLMSSSVLSGMIQYTHTVCNGEYILVKSTDGYLYSINLVDQSDVKEITWENGNKAANWQNGSNNVIYYINKDTVFLTWNGSMNVPPSYSSSATALYSINLKKGQVKMMSTDNSDMNRQFCHTGVLLAPILGNPACAIDLSGNIEYSFDAARTVYLNTFVLSAFCMTTKLNLDEPVVKTADFSMKVTYTVQFEPIDY